MLTLATNRWTINTGLHLHEWIKKVGMMDGAENMGNNMAVLMLSEDIASGADMLF